MAEEEENGEQAVPDFGAVFTYGRCRFADNVPSQFWIRNDPIKQVACGDEHTLLLTKSGRVFSFGGNDWGQLGHGNLKVYTKPTSIKALRGIPAYLIACGKNHSIVALEKMQLVAFGQNSDGELGVGDTEQHNVPVTIEELNNAAIAEAAAGAHHSAVLTNNNQLYLWGSNEEGQLGMPHIGDETLKPVQLEFPDPISHVSCGYYHTAVITAGGSLFTFGEGEHGKLGHPVRKNETVKEPRIVDIPDAVAGVEGGGRHTIAVTQTGQLYVFGDGADGQLGMGNNATELEGPRLLEKLASEKIVQVSCGESHSAAITDQNQVYLWGSDQYGKLGFVENLNQKLNKYFEPRRLLKFAKFDVLQVSCGGCHTIILARPRSSPEHNGNTASKFQVQSILEQCVADNFNKPLDEPEKENAPIYGQGNKLPKLVDSQATDTLHGVITNARTRRRQSLIGQNTSTVLRGHPNSLADRALSVSTEVNNSLNGTSYSKSGFMDVCQDSNLLKNFEVPLNNHGGDDESAAFQCSGTTNGRKHSDTETLHREINKSLTVFCRGAINDSRRSSMHKTHQEEPSSEDDSATDAQPSVSSQRTAVYAQQAAPNASAPPTRMTAAAQKYTRDSGGNDPISTVPGSRNNADERNESKSDEDSERNSCDLKEIGQSRSEFETEDTGLSMLMDGQPRGSHDSETAEDNGETGQTVLDASDESKPDVRPAFAEQAARKTRGPMSRISALLARVKDTKSKGRGEANGKEAGNRPDKTDGGQSRTCVIL